MWGAGPRPRKSCSAFKDNSLAGRYLCRPSAQQTLIEHLVCACLELQPMPGGRCPTPHRHTASQQGLPQGKYVWWGWACRQLRKPGEASGNSDSQLSTKGRAGVSWTQASPAWGSQGPLPTPPPPRLSPRSVHSRCLLHPSGRNWHSVPRAGPPPVPASAHQKQPLRLQSP